ncbi:MAG: hypothetical protein KDC54_10860 [Lewinella sp.]|nr:hypothetical protein [Lewinella sp.]
MGYQSRKRNYRSPREKNAVARRNARVVLLFIAIALVVLVVKNRHDYWAWLKTYLYY